MDRGKALDGVGGWCGQQIDQRRLMMRRSYASTLIDQRVRYPPGRGSCGSRGSRTASPGATGVDTWAIPGRPPRCTGRSRARGQMFSSASWVRSSTARRSRSSNWDGLGIRGSSSGALDVQPRPSYRASEARLVASEEPVWDTRDPHRASIPFRLSASVPSSCDGRSRGSPSTLLQIATTDG